MYVETQLPNGGVITEWVSPPPAPTHKTENITQYEWLKSVLTPSEAARASNIEIMLSGDLSWLNGSVSIDDPIDIVAHPYLAVWSGFTYRVGLASVIKFFNVAPSLDVKDPYLIAGVYLLSIVGALDSPARMPIILQGLPL